MDIFSDNVQFDNLSEVTKLLRDSRAGFLQLFNNSPVCMSMTTTTLGKRSYVRVNKKFLDKFGFEESEILGKTSVEIGILDEEESLRVGRMIQENGRLNNDYVRCRSKNGTIVHTISSIEPMEINGKTLLVSFFIDVSQIKEQQAIIECQIRKLEEANKELELRNNEIESQKNEIDAINNHLEELVLNRTRQLEIKNRLIKEYAFSNSHKVRGPVARILGLAALIRLEPDLLERGRIIHWIEESAKELDVVIKDITKILEEDI